MVVDNHAAIAVQNPAARRQHRHRFDAVLLRPLVVQLLVLYLEPPETRDQEEEDEHCNVLKNSDLPGGEASIVAQRRFLGNVQLEIWIDWRKGHGRTLICACLNSNRSRRNCMQAIE